MSSAFFCEDRKINGQNLALENVWKKTTCQTKEMLQQKWPIFLVISYFFRLGK
jgi:hypothetical protein